jgi:hypothetical protein
MQFSLVTSTFGVFSQISADFRLRLRHFCSSYNHDAPNQRATPSASLCVCLCPQTAPATAHQYVGYRRSTSRPHGPGVQSRSGSPSNSGSRAILIAIRRASSFVSTFCLPCFGIVVAAVEVRERLAVGVPDDIAAGHLVSALGGWEAAR